MSQASSAGRTSQRRASADTCRPEDTIVRAAIHPAIGIARVGDSTEDPFIGPEVVDSPRCGIEQYRDATGALRRQAARFRIYAYNAAGKVVRELTPDNATITWRVHLANKKAAWYCFRWALDLPEVADYSFPLRNPDIKGGARSALVIDPGARHIAGKATQGPRYKFDTGKFKQVPVPLGELRTDEHGRLLVLGGSGFSGSPSGADIYVPKDPATFGNPADWFDDVSDGPVTAEVKIGNRSIPTDKSWVVVAPPNYAPDLVGWRTLYDLLVETYITAGWFKMPTEVSFTQHILPILRRLSQLQWVNAGFAAMFGRGCPMDFEKPTLLAKLAWRPVGKEHDHYQALRQTIFKAFRSARKENYEPGTWPWLYGDSVRLPPLNSPNKHVTLSPIWERLLDCWADGEFVDDYTTRRSSRPEADIDKLPLQQRPAMLDKAALHFCVADAFHPGCELSWTMRHPTMYEKPFRIRHREADEPESDPGLQINSDLALRVGGPLYAQGPGDLTKWLSVPWQVDTAFCRAGYNAEYDPYLPSYWPARVPNQVLTECDYCTVMNTSLSRSIRKAAFHRRLNWIRDLPDDEVKVMLEMVRIYGAMGIVVARPGPKGDPDFPQTIWVESRASDRMKDLLLEAAAIVDPDDPKLIRRLARAGWRSRAQLEAFRTARFRSR